MIFYLDLDTYIDTSEPIDLSLSLENSESNPRAWYVDSPKFEPVKTENWIGVVAEGGSVNFRNIHFNPHGHGTHTECLGHITKNIYSVNQTLKQYFFRAEVISIEPEKKENKNGEMDSVVTAKQWKTFDKETEAVLVRTLPNDKTKKSKNYSNSNPTYFEKEIADQLTQSTINHLLVDTPSVDREDDDGVLAFHHAFWQVPALNNQYRTITELIFVPNDIPDGKYILEIQLAPFENDASPSRPVLYKIKKRE